MVVFFKENFVKFRATGAGKQREKEFSPRKPSTIFRGREYEIFKRC